MAEKARLMKDEYTRQRILSETDPHEIKKLGKEVQNFNEEVWRRHRMDIVIKGNFYKFMANKSLRDYLLSTGNKILVEASPYDMGDWHERRMCGNKKSSSMERTKSFRICTDGSSLQTEKVIS